MAGRVLYTPDPGHSCDPGWTEDLGPPTSWAYPKGTVWGCDECGLTWVSIGSRDPYAPGRCEFRRESRWARRRRERRAVDAYR